MCLPIVYESQSLFYSLKYCLFLLSNTEQATQIFLFCLVKTMPSTPRFHFILLANQEEGAWEQRLDKSCEKRKEHCQHELLSIKRRRNMSGKERGWILRNYSLICLYRFYKSYIYMTSKQHVNSYTFDHGQILISSSTNKYYKIDGWISLVQNNNWFEVDYACNLIFLKKSKRLLASTWGWR